MLLAEQAVQVQLLCGTQSKKEKMKNNVTKIKETKKTQCFSYEVTMLVHIISEDEDSARKQLDEKGGIVTKRDVKIVNKVVLYGEDEK